MPETTDSLSPLNRRAVVRAAHGVVATIVAGALLSMIPASPVRAATERIAGSDRYDTAARLAEQAFSSTGGTVFLAAGETFPDALAAGPAAAFTNSPVLLTARDSLPAATERQLRRLSPTEVVLVGGTGAISSRVESTLRSDYLVTRVAGASRYATASRLSAATFSSGVQAVYIASGESFADALGGGSAAGLLDSPLLLVQHGGIPSEVRSELQRLQPGSIVVLGGTGSVSADVERDLHSFTSGGVMRNAGNDRYSTAAMTSARATPSSVPTVVLATGVTFPDALAGTAAAVSLGGPMLLVRRDCIPVAVNNEIDRLGAQRIIILGGNGAVSAGVEQRSDCPTTTSRVSIERRDTVQYTATSRGWFDRDGQSIGGNPFNLVVARNFCAGCETIHWAEWNIAGQYAAFRGTFGQLDSSPNRTTTIRYRVLVDGIEVFAKEAPFGTAVPVDVNVLGGLRLRVEFVVVGSVADQYTTPAVGDAVLTSS